MTRARRAAVGLAGSALVLAAGFAHGYLARWKKVFPDPHIRMWVADSRTAKGSSATRSPATSVSAEDAAEADALLALGYLAGYLPTREAKGVVQHDRSSVYSGYNLLVSGHAPAAYLLDMDGEVVHSWTATFEDFWPGRKEKAADIRRASHWRRAYLFPNGDLIAMFDRFGLVKLDRRSRILWRFTAPVHHDLDVDESGRILTLLRRAHTIERIDPAEPTAEDFLAILDAHGNQLEEISILEALERSRYASLLKLRGRASGVVHREGDILHTNTVTVLDGRHAARLRSFKKGNLLLCLRSLDLVAVLDPQKREVVWGLTGMWIRPHEPVLLENGRMLIFDNAGWSRGRADLSRALELDPLTQEIKWSYSGPPEFHSPICGLVQRLPNGNTLITVSTEGRVIEVTRDGHVVWEYLSPYSAVVKGQERVATVFEMVRLPSSRVAALLSARAVGS